MQDELQRFAAVFAPAFFELIGRARGAPVPAALLGASDWVPDGRGAALVGALDRRLACEGAEVLLRLLSAMQRLSSSEHVGR